MSIFNMIKINKMVVAFCLMMSVSGLTLAGGPNPGTGDGERLSGPALVGVIMLDGATASFTGKCKGNPVTASFEFNVDLVSVEPEFIEGFRIPAGDLIGECGTAQGTETDIIVNTVTSFTKDPSLVTANVVAMYVVPTN